MAMSKQPDGQNFPKKADVILQNEREIYARQIEISSKIDALSQRLDSTASQISSSRQDSSLAARQITEIYVALKDEYNGVKQEILYLAKQNENIYSAISETLQELKDQVSALKEKVENGRSPVNNSAERTVASDLRAEQLSLSQAYMPEIDYDLLAKKVSDVVLERMPVQEVISPDYIASKIAEQIIIPPATVEGVDLSNAQIDINADELADRISIKLGALRTDDFDILVDDDGCASIAREVSDKLNYDLISAAVAEKLRAELDLAHVGEPDYDYLSTKVSEKINTVSFDENVIAEKTAAVVGKYLPEIDTDDIADKVVRQILSTMPESETVVADADGDLITEETSYDIYIDDDGIDTIAQKVTESVMLGTGERFDGVDGEIAQIKESLLNAGLTDEQAENISSKVVTLVSERMPDEIKVDTIADKVCLADEQIDLICDRVANIVLDRMPKEEAVVSERAETFSDEQIETISSKVADIVLERMPKEEAVVSERAETFPDEQIETISSKVADIVLERMPKEDLVETESSVELSDEQIATVSNMVADLVIDRMPESKIVENITGVVAEYDEATVESLCEKVTEKVTKQTDGRFDKVESDISEIKDMLANGVIVSKENVITDVQTAEIAEVEDSEVENELEVDEDVSEEEQLVTVSEVVSDTVEEETEQVEQEPLQETETVEEVQQEAEEAVEPSEENDEVIDEIVEDINEEITSEEEMPDGIDEGEGGVDFANMMKYNRSYIARIIQSTDEQKNYYGAVKHALLSYKKVNSNIAWGAERFSKGRETIARFKIRGKTLCLYLALDPSEYKQTVYHHVDVTDNKSMTGTPMMVKIKSEMGVKKAIRLIDEMLEKRNGEQRNVPERDYAAMYPYESIEELIEDGLVKDVRKNK